MNNVFIDINQEKTIFTYRDQSQLVLDIGYERLIQQHFHHNLPTPYETEVAIITIEDAIERIYPKWQPVDTVITDNRQLSMMARYFGSNRIDKSQVEMLFNRVADIIAGSPKRENELPDSIEFIASLLILREVLHHLGIEYIEVV